MENRPEAGRLPGARRATCSPPRSRPAPPAWCGPSLTPQTPRPRLCLDRTDSRHAGSFPRHHHPKAGLSLHRFMKKAAREQLRTEILRASSFCSPNSIRHSCLEAAGSSGGWPQNGSTLSDVYKPFTASAFSWRKVVQMRTPNIRHLIVFHGQEAAV